MPVTLAVVLPWGRLHATPWDRNVNEGAVEWPPSPWRLLRALYATWRSRAPELEEEVVTRMLGGLASPPAYLLPRASQGHTRHYLPDWTSGAPRWDPTRKEFQLRRTDKVVDAFAAAEPGAELRVRWDVDLPAVERQALAVLSGHLGYLGRAESVCEARLLDGDGNDDRPPSLARSTWMCAEDVDGGRATPLLCPEEPLDLAALTVETAAMRTARLLQPAGSRWVTYPAVEEDPEPAGPSRSMERVVARPQVVRWAISAPARPPVTAAVAMADALRAACQSRFGTPPSATLSGKHPDGAPLQGHRHAHYLAHDEDGDGLLDTLYVWAPGGLGAEEVAALASLVKLRRKPYLPAEDYRPCNLGLEAVGPAAVVAPRLVGPSSRWTSVTPFAPTQHPRRQNTPTFVDQQVRLELRRRDLPDPLAVHIVVDGRRRLASEFRRHRVAERRTTDMRPAHMVDVTFPEEVAGPLALGALSHFGLGLLVPG